MLQLISAFTSVVSQNLSLNPPTSGLKIVCSYALFVQLKLENVHTHTHTHVRLLDERLTDRSRNGTFVQLIF